MTKTVNISILGSGVVGTIIGQGFQQLGHHVLFYDIDRDQIQALRHAGYSATLDIEHAVHTTDISFICVPTPTQPDGLIDLRMISAVVEALGQALRTKPACHLIAVKSTVLPTTTEHTIRPLLERQSGKIVGKQVGLCVNPEFLTEIHQSWTDDATYAHGFFNEPYIIIGAEDPQSRHQLTQLYTPLKTPIVQTDYRSAELMKYAVNCALASRISYWNEMFYICRKLGVDSQLIASTAARDHRIGHYGTIHGKAFGGKCLPKDLAAFITFARTIGYQPKLLTAIEAINKQIGTEHGIRE